MTGFVLSRLGRIPSAGDRFEYEGWRFEVVDMDGRGIDKLLVIRDRGKEAVVAPALRAARRVTSAGYRLRVIRLHGALRGRMRRLY